MPPDRSGNDEVRGAHLARHANVSLSADLQVDANTLRQWSDLWSNGRADLVKMDIEGAAISLLSRGDWVDF